MKKYLYAIIILSIAGAILAGALFYQHYDPDAAMGILSCGNGLENPCISVGQSPYSRILGIPIAAFGLLFFLVLIFSLLIADYAGEGYITVAARLTLPLSLLALAVDLVLAVLMYRIGDFCTLCFYTYLVNALICAAAFLWYRRTRTEGAPATLSVLKNFFKTGPLNADAKAALSSYTLFIFLLAFSLFATNFVMNAKTAVRRSSPEKIHSFLTKFYESDKEELDLPSTKIVLGNPEAELTIVVFTDFLCSACYSFYKTEKYLLARFKGKLKIHYYHYPLDALCNSDVERTVYANSCVASRAVNAAAKQGILTDYLIAHFSHYKEFKNEYSEEWAASIYRDLEKKLRIQLPGDSIFIKEMDSPENKKILNDHVLAAKKLRIDATPTLFIANRRLVGVPPRDLLESLVDSELKKAK